LSIQKVYVYSCNVVTAKLHAWSCSFMCANMLWSQCMCQRRWRLGQ
jgi:hypothetical protein